MIKNKNNGKSKGGFTLIELLAVIVVLAIILVIAVPKIMNTIEDARKGSFESTAKLIASQAETKYISNSTLGITGEIKCEDVAKLSDNDYDTCKVSIENGFATVTIVGKGKFDGMYVCNATKTSAEVVEEECPLPAAETLATLVGTNGLTETSDGNVRYVGSSTEVKNYVEFGNENELWRIIGVFEVETSSGKTEKLMKLVRNDSLISASWDSSASGTNAGYGINQWGPSGDYEGADLMQLLNGYYIGESTTCMYCNGKGQGTCSKDCTSSVTPINSTYKNMIEEVVWHTGGVEWAFGDASMAPLEVYANERPTEIGTNGEGTGKICSTSGTECNDTVERTIEWTGKVGLIYPSDYGFAGGTSCTDITSETCGTNNWLKPSLGYMWAISPAFISEHAHGVWAAGSESGDLISIAYLFQLDGSAIVFGACGTSSNVLPEVRPSIYLKSNVQITGDGDGSINAPYKLSM